MAKRMGPVVIELDSPETAEEAHPADAPMVVDVDNTATAQAIAVAAKPGRIGWIGRIFWSALLALLGAILSVAMWDFANDLIARNIWLGRAVIGALILMGLAALFIILRELAALSRLRRVDRLRLAEPQLGDRADVARHVDRVTAIYRNRPDMRWASESYHDAAADIFDGPALRDHAEATLMAPLDMQARREIEAAARQVAVVTALVPLALADVVAALTANIRMIRRIAEIYGGRSGTLGSWRLMRAVAAHLVATGAVAIGDDLIGSVAGGGVVSKLSRRFGEGVINAALTARVGVAAMDVCRPMRFQAQTPPKVTHILGGSLKGVFSGSGEIEP